MKNKTLYLIWGGLFILCGLLGFIPAPAGFLKGLLVALSAVFFVPGWILLYRGQAKAVRNLSLASLGVTLLLLVLNFLSGRAAQAVGDYLYGLLVIFSAPMVCSQYWFFSLFVWACLLMAGISAVRKTKKSKK